MTDVPASRTEIAPAGAAETAPAAPLPVHDSRPQRSAAEAPSPTSSGQRGGVKPAGQAPGKLAPGKAGRLAKRLAAQENVKPAKELRPDSQKEIPAAPTVEAGAWPANWREALAGDDRALLKRLERFEGPRGILDWALNAEKRLTQRQAEAMRPAADATPEERKAWREAAGIPETPEQYVLTLRNGRALGDDDRPVFDGFARAAHEAGLSNAQISRVMDWHFDLVEKTEADIIDEDEQVLAASVRQLETEWGPALYRRAIAGVRQLFADAPRGMEALILGARMENGRKIGGDAAALRFLARLAHEVFPPSTFIPDTDASGRGINAEIAAIEKVMQSDNAQYWRDPKMQERYGELLAARDGGRGRR